MHIADIKDDKYVGQENIFVIVIFKGMNTTRTLVLTVEM